MKKYVSKDDVLEVLQELHNSQTVSKYSTHAQCIDVREGIKMAIQAVEDMQVEDAVQVVRCKDCELHKKCVFEDTFAWTGVADGYCAVGKPKE